MQIIKKINKVRSAIVKAQYNLQLGALELITDPAVQTGIKMNLERGKLGRDLHLEMRERYQEKILIDTRIYRDIIVAFSKMVRTEGLEPLQDDPEVFFPRFRQWMIGEA